MAATALQLNWTNVEIATTPLTRVMSISFSQGGELIEFTGDNNRYPVVIANSVNRPTCSITSGDVATVMGLAPGSSGTITAVQNDAEGAIGGAINWTMINAVHANSEEHGQWGTFPTATATFRAYSADGTTNPLSFTRS